MRGQVQQKSSVLFCKQKSTVSICPFFRFCSYFFKTSWTALLVAQKSGWNCIQLLSFFQRQETHKEQINYFASVYIYGNTGCGLQAWGKQNSKYFCIHKKFFKGITYTVYLILLHTPSFLLEIRVIIKISKNPWYPINCD